MKKILSIALMCALLLTTTIALFGCNSAKEVQVIDIKLTDEEYAFAVKKDNPELLAKVNEILAEIKANGKFDEIVNKYFAEGAKAEDIAGFESAKLDKTKDQLVVATNAAFAPFEYMNGNKFCGIDMDIAKILAEKMNKELVIVHMSFDAVLLDVGVNSDIGMAGLTITEDRKQTVNFSAPYYNASQRIITMKGDNTFAKCTTVKDVEDVLNSLKNKTIGHQKGTTGGLYLAGDEDFDFPGYKNITAKAYDNGAQAVQDMINGNIDFVVLDDKPAMSIATTFNSKARG